MTIVLAFVLGEIGAAALMLVLALVLGLLSWALVRMTPRYSTRQGVSTDGTGVTLTQEPKRWFSGRAVHIPWSRVRRISKEVVASQGAEGRIVRYFIDIELRDAPDGAELPTWSSRDGDKIRIQSKKVKHAEILGALRVARPDLFAAD
ncbi:hypothetical protein ACTWPP_21375 [Actinomadura sp. 3N407]